MKSNLLSLALLLLGAGALALVWLGPPLGLPESTAASTLGLSIGGVLVAVGVISLSGAISRGDRSGTFLRLDHFLPFLRKGNHRRAARRPRLVLRLARRLLPGLLLADSAMGKPGLIRKLLKRAGPTVVSSPVRRAIQTACFLLFLGLFFYVCWPYGARPEPPGRISPGWRLAEISQSTGQFLFENPNPPSPPLETGKTLHVVDQRELEATEGYVGPFKVVGIGRRRIRLLPHEELTARQLDQLLLSPGPWSLYETAPGRWPSHYADQLARRQFVPADLFLMIDPLVSMSTALAARCWVGSLACAAAILIVCMLIPRGFCGYLCPLGTLIDLFDLAIGNRVTRFRLPDRGWWVHVKYYLLLATLVAALFGVLLSGYVAAIPVLTRGMLFLGEPVQSGLLRGWHLVPPMNAGHAVSLALFLLVLALGLLKPRFWCKYVCPSGAVFSLGNLFRISQRKVESSCTSCNKCVEICPFDAIKPDFTTRTADCTLCQTCGGVCPTGAIKFVERWNRVDLKTDDGPPASQAAMPRRGFLSLAAGTAAALVGGAGFAAAAKTGAAGPRQRPPIRPPGSVPEQQFLDLCIRCGQCLKVCPNNVLQAMGFQQGWDNLWTPQVVPDWAGCESSCNACGQVCPTGAIRALPLEEKKAARIGLAVVDQQTCLPFAARQACQLCVDECQAAGYKAIEFTQVHTEVDEQGRPVEGTGWLAPVVLADRCVGCGLCQTRCRGINVAEKGLLEQSAIVVEAGEGKEDRLRRGSFRQLRRQEQRRRKAELRRREQAQRALLEQTGEGNGYLVPDQSTGPFGTVPDDPFAAGSPRRTEHPRGP